MGGSCVRECALVACSERKVKIWETYSERRSLSRARLHPLAAQGGGNVASVRVYVWRYGEKCIYARVLFRREITGTRLAQRNTRLIIK